MLKILKQVAIGLVLSVPVASFAIPVTVNYDEGTTWQTTSLTGYSTNGAQMDGMEVTVFFADGGTEILSWTDIESTSGGVTGSGWSLNEYGDTFNGYWTLQTTTAVIDRLVINGAPGNTVFDILENATGTIGSALGHEFDVKSYSGFTAGTSIDATYRDMVTLTGSTSAGDLYRVLDIDFVGGDMNSGSLLKFVSDTDNLLYAGDITPVSVPEPGVLLLLGTSLLPIALAGMKKRTKK